ncbi:aminotransferase class III-fold pyridoxal phosphate-dependent enzyme [Ralstonia pseudosolanacearum]|uniref:aminotransferase class III-fold pyridoxal phosphate-dependent enzyme n=1 Tax=Ralstonia pseudosolanacearum TaxID=1310165 RepID=UPI001FF8C56E|nr:aminotransferase class III-fold pyridoxal phosphate-dependent enzyme [Ralstonia pseudosolanacearum]
MRLDHREQFQVPERLHEDFLMDVGNRYDESRRLLDRLRRYDALASARPNIFWGDYAPTAGVPLFASRSEGAYLWDVDGHRYIDCALGYGSVVLGHGHPAVADAMQQAAGLGGHSTLLNRWHAELAQRFVDMIPAAEMVAFLRTGSDAVSAAVRLARAITQRRVVLHWGLHGWHDWCAPGAQGILQANREHVFELRYNDPDHAAHLVSTHGPDLAAIVMMPYEIDPPAAGYLHFMQALARKAGALFVLDEVRSGFRIALGGAQSYFGLEPDLSAFGKALGNGYCISALAGRACHLQHILKLGLTVTHYRSPDVMAAAVATLETLDRSDVPTRLTVLGERLMSGLDRAFAASGVPGRAVGFPATPFVRFDDPRPNVRDRMVRHFVNGMLAEGVLMFPTHHWFLCAAMTDADIDAIVAAAERVLAGLRGTIDPHAPSSPGAA